MNEKPSKGKDKRGIKSKGKSPQKEKAISTLLQEMGLTFPQIYYIMWRFAPQMLDGKGIKTFEDLCGYYKVFTPGQTEEYCRNWLLNSIVQQGVKLLQTRLYNLRLFELYDKIYEKAAQGDVQAFKAFVELGTGFFKDNEESELLTILNNANISENDEKEQYGYFRE